MKDLDKNRRSAAFEILMAIRNLISCSVVVTVSTEIKRDLVSLVPFFIDFSYSEEDIPKFTKICSLIIEIITQCAKKNPEISDFLDEGGL
mmetsp:Transcript_5251/g.6246  ORF Transcript_5251/g.6246 Transcript_5251/m.6246 type:complete len:90 (-) Transcript_5251:345-614(-)